MSWSVGVDVGGTFTDFFAYDAVSGTEMLWKRPTTPDDPGQAVVLGLQELARAAGLPLDRVTRLCHGTTVATNALIQRRGAEVAMVTTKGFRDLVEIGRQVRPHLYDLHRDYPPPLAPRERRYEVLERIGPDGQVIAEIDWRDVDEIVAEIAKSGVPAVSVCFLFSYLNPAHERAVGTRIREAMPDVAVSLSSDVQPEFREYERFTTTILNSYLQPVVDRYLSNLDLALQALVPAATLRINQSNGGTASIEASRHAPVRIALSGPAAGVVGAAEIAKRVAQPNVVTIDIGGTSADVALIKDGRAEIAYGRDVDGFPIRLPMVDITTIGAGGGSIAWFDRDGLLKVGPASAGADPGPACYGLGGTQPTVSDANLVLGRLSGHLGAGRMPLDVEKARTAIEKIAHPMGKSVEEAAAGILAIAVANMVRAIRTLSVERGHDPRGFALMAFGGAGPLHGRDVAAALSMPRVLVPAAPGVVCAEGLLCADIKTDFAASLRTTCLDTYRLLVEERLAGLAPAVDDWISAEGADPAEVTVEVGLDARYVGQNFELSLPVAKAASVERLTLPGPESLRSAFFDAHEQAYGFHDPDAPIELVNCRVAVTAPPPGARAPLPGPAPHGSEPAKPVGRRKVSFDGRSWEDASVYDRADLAQRQAIDGPALIEQMDSTTLVFPGDRAVVEAGGVLVITLNGQQGAADEA